MPFKFLKYLQPTHYFRLKNQYNRTTFPITKRLPKMMLDRLELDNNYKSKLAKDYDLSWQAIQNGYIGHVETYSVFEKVPVIDEYRFIRKNFHIFWVIHVLVLRLVSFKNPFVELSAFFKTTEVKRKGVLKGVFPYKMYDTFQSKLIQQNPLVSVVIPTLNRYKYLKDVLKDLEQQTYTNFEVLVVDQSDAFDSAFYKSFDLDIQLMHQEKKALWLARNTAVKKSKGDLLLLFDDDSRVAPNWISEHIKTLDYFQSDMSSGVSISKVGAKVPDNYSFFRISDQLDTGNVLIKKDVFKQIGLFDRQFEKQRMGDGEYGLRAYLYGYLNISNPKAERLHLKVGSGGLREMGSWDAFRTKNITSPRPIPSVLYLYRKYFGTKRSMYALLKTVPISLVPYKFKNNQKLLILGYVIVVLLSPLILFQILKSWRLSSIKLREGAKIEKL
ncbi:glycosyltransferase family 2 protein [uncultured Algibacter sp.]|uniref:glycosyltransferase family 2 protein n=1 Tax=uncultured Algibacter sp. TaxID=298659 RepID=UPI0026044E1A|nr:glycosyltransferase family A protein [uncultured Algibacter sp.]